MLSDQKQYLKFLQITSDLVCYVVLYLLIIPVTLTLAQGKGADLVSFDPTLSNHCIYKSHLYIGLSLVFIFGASLLSWFVSMILPGRPLRHPFTLMGLPVFISLTHSFFLWFFFDLLNVPQISPITLIFIPGLILFLVLMMNRIHILLIMQNNDHNYLIKSIVLAGVNPESTAMAEFITRHPESGLRLAGFLYASPGDTAPPPGIKILGTIDKLPSLVQDHIIDIVLIPDTSMISDHMDFLFKTCATMGIKIIVPAQKVAKPKKAYYSSEVLNHKALKMYSFVYIKPGSAFFKRMFDFCGSACLILLCIPLWIVVPLLIKSSSKGRIFFKQKRVGRYGRTFTLYKFRSMYSNSEALQSDLMHLNEMDGPAFKIKNDPRQTPTGKVLRKYSLDELPQLLNVFRGDISLVGPRPAKENEVMQYRPGERRRLSVTQGITCIWQVSGRNEIKFDEWMKLDLMYIDHWSSVSDFKILFRTIPAVLMKRGAY